MATRELAPVRAVAAPPADGGGSAYGTVEIEWYPDRLRIVALGAGPASITESCLSDDADDVVVEIRLPRFDELPEIVPGAD